MTEKAGKDKALATNYSELYRLEQTGDYDRALKIANKILHLSPNEAIAFQCKVVCFIQSSKFDEALAFMKRNPQLSENLHFEKAYCLYRSNKSIEALNEIEKAEELDFRLLELRAQVYYRLERFTESFNEYQEIIKAVDDDYENERETNMGAALTYAGVETIKTYSPNMRDDTYEVCFNKACQLISLGQYNEAEKKLRQCEKLCRDALEEDGATEDEILLELAHARIQLGFVYQKQGRIREAQQLYLNSLKLKLEDIALCAVACNNAVVINKDQNVFDSKKKMKVATNELLNHKILEGQKKYITLNNALLSFYTNQLDQCNKLCDIIEKTWPDLSTITTVLHALVLMKNKNYDKALALLEEHPASDHDGKLYLSLCQVQLWLMQGNRQKSCDILERSGEDRYRPGIVGALITLYLAEGKEEIAQKIYKETVEWYKVNKKGEGDLTNLWRQAAEFHMRNGQAAVAANSLEELLSANPNDTKTIGQLVVAYAEFDTDKAIKLGHDLYSMEEIAVDLDIDNVESSVWLSAKKVAPSRSDGTPGSPGSTSLTDSTNGRRKKKSHKKKGKLPKFYDPKIPADPERWLPKYERTGYRKKRDRRLKDVIKGSQGTTSGQAELFDYSGKSANDSEAQDSPSSVDPSPATRQQKGKNLQKKKNKRR